MRVFLLADTLGAAVDFREGAGLSPRECVIVSEPQVIHGILFREEDMVFEWPRFRQRVDATEILEKIRTSQADAGPEWHGVPQP